MPYSEWSKEVTLLGADASTKIVDYKPFTCLSQNEG